MRQSPSKAQATAHGLSIGIYDTALVCNNNKYDHNVFYDLDESAILISTYGIAGAITNNSFRNNILFDTGLDPYNLNNPYNQNTAVVIFEDSNSNTSISNNSFKNNLIYNGMAASDLIYLRHDDVYLTVLEFNNYTGNETFSNTNNISSEPDVDANFSPFLSTNNYRFSEEESIEWAQTRLSILDETGRQIRHIIGSQSFNLRKLPVGIYFVVLEYGEERWTFKVKKGDY